MRRKHIRKAVRSQRVEPRPEALECVQDLAAVKQLKQGNSLI